MRSNAATSTLGCRPKGVGLQPRANRVAARGLARRREAAALRDAQRCAGTRRAIVRGRDELLRGGGEGWSGVSALADIVKERFH